MNEKDFSNLKRATTIRLYPVERFFQPEHPSYFTIRGANIPTEEYRKLTERPHLVESIYDQGSILGGSFTVSGYTHWLPRECIASIQYSPMDTEVLKSIRPRQYVKVATYREASDFISNRRMDWYLSSQAFWDRWFVVQTVNEDEVNIGECSISKDLLVGVGPVLYKLGDTAIVLPWRSIKDIYGVTKNSHKEIVVNGFRHYNHEDWDNQLSGEVIDFRKESPSRPDTTVYKLRLSNGDERWFNWGVLRCPPKECLLPKRETAMKLKIDNKCTQEEMWDIARKHSMDDLEMELCSWEEAKQKAGPLAGNNSFQYKNVYYYKENEWGKTLKVSRALGEYGEKNKLLEEYTTGHAYVYSIDFVKKFIVRHSDGKVITYTPIKTKSLEERLAETIEYTEYFKAMLSKIPVGRIIIARFREPQEIREMPGIEFTGAYNFTYQNRGYGTRDYPWGTDCHIVWEGGDHVRCVKSNEYYHIDFIKGFSVFSGPGNAPAEKTYKRGDYPMLDTTGGTFTVNLPPTQLGIKYIIKEEKKMKKEDIAKLNITADNLKSAAKEVKAQRDKKDQDTAKAYLTQLLTEEDQLVAEKAKVDARLKEVQEMIASLGYPPKD